MLNSRDNPECSVCGQAKTIGCGTKLVDGRRTHMTLYNCMAGGKPSCTNENCIKKQDKRGGISYKKLTSMDLEDQFDYLMKGETENEKTGQAIT